VSTWRGTERGRWQVVAQLWLADEAERQQVCDGDEGRLDQIDARVDRMAGRVEQMDNHIQTRLDAIEGRRADDFKFLIRMHILQFVGLASGIILVLGVIARAQHWI
jgi:hypothetical protein